MDEILLKQLVRQINILNFWVTFFGVLFIATFVVAGILIFKAVTYIHDTQKTLQSTQQKVTDSLNVQKQVCDSSASNLLKQYTTTCR